MSGQIKPTGGTYIWHNLQGHSSGSPFLTVDLNSEKYVSSLYSFGKIFHVLAPREVNVTVSYLTEFTESFRISKIIH